MNDCFLSITSSFTLDQDFTAINALVIIGIHDPEGLLDDPNTRLGTVPLSWDQSRNGAVAHGIYPKPEEILEMLRMVALMIAVSFLPRSDAPNFSFMFVHDAPHPFTRTEPWIRTPWSC